MTHWFETPVQEGKRGDVTRKADVFPFTDYVIFLDTDIDLYKPHYELEAEICSGIPQVKGFPQDGSRSYY